MGKEQRCAWRLFWRNCLVVANTNAIVLGGRGMFVEESQYSCSRTYGVDITPWMYCCCTTDTVVVRLVVF